MADEFRAWGLSSLANIFVTGGAARVPDKIDLNAPAQPVVDLSRLAQRGRLASFQMQAAIPAAPGGATVVYVEASSIADTVAAAANDQLDIWIMRLACLVDQANYANFSAARFWAVPFANSWDIIAGPPPVSGEVGYPYVLQTFAGATSSRLTGFAIGGYQWAAAKAGNDAPREMLPFLVRPDGGSFGFEFDGSDACQVLGLFECWIGPRGGTPPGMP